MNYLRKLKIYHLIGYKPKNDIIFYYLLEYSETVFNDITIEKVNKDIYLYRNSNYQMLFLLDDDNILKINCYNYIITHLKMFNFDVKIEIIKYLISKNFKLKNKHLQLIDLVSYYNYIK